MAETSIEWCDYTFNPWRGCSKVAEGCRFCYAEVDLSVKMHGIKWGPQGTRVVTSPSYWKQPLKWNREAERDGVRRRVFCASLADVFEDWAGPILTFKGEVLHQFGEPKRPKSQSDVLQGIDLERDFFATTLGDVRRDLFSLIDATPHLDWLLLTKRPENIRRMWPLELRGSATDPGFRRNVWLGTSISCKKDLPNIDHIYACSDLAPVRFVSAEPLIEGLGRLQLAGIDWLIAGGESGHNARPCEVAWIRSLLQQCQSASVPVFVKQLGANCITQIPAMRVAGATHGQGPNGMVPASTGLMKFRDPKGGDMAEWPEDLRVRQFPEVHHA